ncbi:class D beta-lactamase [Variovorax sp. J22R133]|uniref:class D beta-lactamase n=1 Tax=Variovorax brevis TaxID=3053503 RepID=UPI0025751307|nr:class D beta-lactamase [Variovorax sp. J22R133]MDM0115458.1 class D beta-lactamase [Variovorax sp. J22R133]
MNRRQLILSAAPLFVAGKALAASDIQERSDWSAVFTASDAQGTIAVVDGRRGREATRVFDRQRAARRYTPASTFKVPHSLFALDAGLLRDEFQVIPWDGVQRSVPAWNADQDLRSAMRNSTVWVFERFARELGTKRETEYLQRIGYGNELATGAQPFWVEGDLAISALEQVAFLQALYRNQLPFRVQHQRLVKDVMVNEAGPDWILRAKSGWSGKVGWWVGWVEWPSGPVFFALIIDTPKRMSDLPKRMDITRRILRSLDALPQAAS